MQTIFDLKEQAVTDTPLLVFTCLLPDGRKERWSTHRVSIEDEPYSARILRHNIFEIQTASDQGVDGIPRISMVLANADSHFSEIERAIGWKGSRLSVAFLFYDLRNNAALTKPFVMFQGICNPPDEITESTFRLTATNRMNLQRLLLPQVRIQRRCPWEFPSNQEQRIEAIDGGQNGKYSRYYRCGYSGGEAGGSGNLNGGVPFTACAYTRSDCQARGMFTHFGGIEFVPPAIAVRTYGEKSSHTSAVSVNATRYNDFVPMIYGTAWYTPPVVFARNDGNLTRMEALLGIGEMQGVIKVLVNGVEIPAGVPGTNMTGTGWYNVPTLGTRAGAFNLDFVDASGQPAGDPYGSMAYLSVVVPNRLNDGTTLPKVQVLAQGLKLPVYGADGSLQTEEFSNNPAWVLLDILRRSGWALSEIDVPSFAEAAAYCAEPISATDLYGNDITLPRFQCNLVLQTRRSAGDVARGVRNSARMLLTYGASGVLQLRVENSLARELPVKPDWSNSTEVLNGGWPSYEFGDGSNGFSGILRGADGEPSFRVYARSIADTPNRFSVEFQDALNEYQQDSFSLVDPDDVARGGQEVSATLAATGLPNYDQAARILKLNLDKSIRGNTYIEFETSVRAFGVRPGDVITVTYLKEGFNRQPFRVLKLAPAANYRVTTITAQIHDDTWYADDNGQVDSTGGRRQGDAGIGLPRPLLGTVVDENGEVQFGIEETTSTANDGSIETSAVVSFVSPAPATAAGPGIPLLSLAPIIGNNGTLKAGERLYYAVSAQDAAGQEGALSFIIFAAIQSTGSSVTIKGLSFAPGTEMFHVYRGVTPAQLYRIASDQPIADEFTDTGLPKQLISPPDPNYDHANFYWRMELQPETAVTLHSATTIGASTLQMTENRYRGATAKITRGRGAGQERTILANTATTLTVTPSWNVEPDATSFLAVAESSWQFGALAKSSPVQFTIPNRSGETIEICGRAANVNDLECALELSTVTRWQIGGAGGDADVPPEPVFLIGPGQRGGMVELSGVSFTDLNNTHTISAGTLTLHYKDELDTSSQPMLAAAVGTTDEILELTAPGNAENGSYLQIDTEVMRVEEVQNGAMRYRVTRGIHTTEPATHEIQTAVGHLITKTVIASFPPDFFGSPYSGSWSLPITLPNVRIASAEFFVMNVKGNSPTATIGLTNTVDRGLRTLSGGQYSIQADGFLSVDQSIAPVLVVESSRSVRDIFGILSKPADAIVQVRVNVNGTEYCTLTFETGSTVSDNVNGAGLPPLRVGDHITASVVSVGQTYPGADLSVLIRL